MDLTKTDSTFVFLLLLAFWVGRRAAKRPGMLVMSGALFVLATLTKQLALSVAAAVILITIITTRGQSWPQLVSFVTLATIAFFTLEKYSDGWFSFMFSGFQSTTPEHRTSGDP